MKYLILLLASASVSAQEPRIRLYPGYVTKIRCEGRLLVSAVGNDQIVRLEPLPKDLGCVVVIKPLVTRGQTNLILETSTGSIQRILEIVPADRPAAAELEYRVKGQAS